MTKVHKFYDKKSLVFAKHPTHRRFKVLDNERFGRLTVLGYAGQNKWSQACWFVECECSSIKKMVSGSLTNGSSLSCGCLRSELVKERSTTHGERYHSLYRVWTDMKTRCNNPKIKQYKYWGGRGITVCDEWINDFKSFFDWAMANGYEEGLQIDRRENNNGYKPGNCRWVSRIINGRNQRVYANNKTGFTGVMKGKSGKYRSLITVNCKRIHLGFFETIKEAARVRNNYIIKNKLEGFNLAKL